MVRQRGGRKALAVAIAVMFVLGMGSSASALSFTNLVSYVSSISGKLKVGDRVKVVKKPEGGGNTHPVPEPSAALVFGLGLLVASRFARRAR